jgi:hypothetical protein
MKKGGKMKRPTVILLFVMFIALLLSGVAILGCSSDNETSKEESTLPEDTGEQTLLDTTAVRETPAEAPKTETKQIAEKPRPTTQPSFKEQPKPKEPEVITTTILPENTAMEVTLLTGISTAENQIGDRFRAMVKGPAEKGQTLDLPAGTILEGIIAEMKDGTAEKEKASIKLRFTDFILPGEKPIPIEGYIITDDGTGVITAAGQAGTIAKDAGLGAIAGGVIGAIAGKKDEKTETAVKGAAAGAVIGGVAGALLHKDRVVFQENSETKVIIVSPVVQKTVRE